jgi:uncharacterized protein (DUF1330 family)
MAAYVIADVEVTNPEGYAGYTQQVPATIAAFGGEFAVRGGRCQPLEGGWEPKRLVVLRFDNVERARAWYDSPEYQAILPLRTQNSRGRLVLVEGVASS